MADYWVCARSRETGEWMQCVRWDKLEDAQAFAQQRLYDLGRWVRVEDGEGRVISEYKAD